jgi:hypothetical protein
MTRDQSDFPVLKAQTGVFRSILAPGTDWKSALAEGD